MKNKSMAIGLYKRYRICYSIKSIVLIGVRGLKHYKVLILILIVSIVLSITGCIKKVEKNDDKVEENDGKVEGGIIMEFNQLEQPEKGEEIAIITTNYGEIKLRLFPEIAPKAVENFKTHAKNGYYEGVTFHRVMNDFMIQGGDPQGTGVGGESIWGKSFEDEFDINYHNFRGALSMANTGQPTTNGSQFFIVQNSKVREDMMQEMKSHGKDAGYTDELIEKYEELGGTPWLDYRHTVFGHVFEGMDVVDKIADVEVDGNAKPIEPVIMEKIEIVKHK